MNVRSMIKTRAGMLAFGTVAFGTGMVAITHHEFARMWNITFPGTLIPIAACYLVGLCWGEAMWQFLKRREIAPQAQNDV